MPYSDRQRKDRKEWKNGMNICILYNGNGIAAKFLEIKTTTEPWKTLQHHQQWNMLSWGGREGERGEREREREREWERECESESEWVCVCWGEGSQESKIDRQINRERERERER